MRKKTRLKKMVAKITSLLMSLMLILNCMGTTAFAYAMEDGGEGRPDSSEVIDQPLDAPLDSETTRLNGTPITGSRESNGVSIQVTAPENSFPEGTTVKIETVPAEEGKVGFNVTFFDPSGAEVQPVNGQAVPLLFSIDENSALLAGHEGDATIVVYHRGADGTVEALGSAAVDGNALQIGVTARHFSEYGVMFQSAPSKDRDETASVSLGEAQPETSTKAGNGLVGAVSTAPKANRAGDVSSAFHATITTNNDTYESGTTAIVSVKYNLDQGVVAAGDYVIMTIPESIASSVSFSLNSQHFSGYEYLGGGQYKLTFGSGVETGLSGSFSAFVTTSADTTTTDTISVGDASTTITVVPGGAPSGPGVYTDSIMKDGFDNPGVHYGGYDYSDGYGDHAAQIGLVDLTDGGTFKYRLYVNNKEALLSNVTVIDQLPDGMTFNAENGFQVMDATTGETIDPSLYTITVSGQTITFSYPGEFNNRIQINYWVDIPAGSNSGKYTNTATITYTQDGNVYQEHRNYVLQGTENSASNGEKGVDKTEISTDPDDQFVTYTIKFWNSNGFAAGEINLIEQLDPYVSFVSASSNEYFSIVQDPGDPQKISITNTQAIAESMTVYVYFIVDMTNVPEGYTVENTVGGNTTKTTKDVSLRILATKTVDDEEPGDLTFEFELCDAEGTVLQTKENNASGEIAFDAINYGADDIGTHVYTVREKTSSGNEYDQDSSVYTVTVTVSRSETGSLVTDVVYSKDNGPVQPSEVVFNNTSRTISVSGTKTWVGDSESVRPESITVRLWANGEEVTSQTVTAATDWNYEFTDLPKYENGVEIQYSVTEDPINGYVSEVDGFDITNTYAPSATNLVLGGTKTFEGYPEGAEAPVFTYTLSEGDQVIDTKTTQGAGDYQFDTIVYDAPGTHVYTVSETEGSAPGVAYDDTVYTLTVTVADDGNGALAATVTGADPEALDFTNRYTAASTSLQFSGLKTLEGKTLQEGEFSFTLTGSDGTNETVTNDAEGRIVFSEITFDAPGTYTYEVQENATDEDGVVIDSTVYNITVEVTDDGNGQLSATVAGADISALNFTNTFSATIDIPVTKVWVGPEAGPVTVELLADGTKVAEATLSADGGWQHTFTDLDQYAADGHEIAYTIEEVSVEGYETEIAGNAADGFVVTNTNTETLDIPVTKVWVGPEAGPVTVALLADGAEAATLELSADNGWAGAFEGLPVYSPADGHEIAYDVAEVEVEGYTTARSGTASTGFIFTNTASGKVSVPVTKVWVGPEAGPVTVELLADGTKVAEATLSADGGWQHTFTDLDQYAADGHEIAYTIEEVSVEGYTTEIAGNAADGFVVTNTNTETITISGAKTWNDADNQDGIRPESITVHLIADGAEVDSRTVGPDEDWAWSFERLTKYDQVDGHEIVFEIIEDPIEGYTAAYEGFNIINEHVTEKTSVEVTKVWSDQDNKDGIRPASVTIHLIADGVDTGMTLILNEENGWTGRFADLDAFNAGEKVAYTVMEDSVDGYSTSIEGDADTGFTVTNTHDSEKPTPEKPTPEKPTTKKSTPKTGEESIVEPIALMSAVALGLAVILRAYTRRRCNDGV